MKILIFLALLACAFSALVNLDNQPVPITDLSTYKFKAYISNTLFDVDVQLYRSAGGFLT